MTFSKSKKASTNRSSGRRTSKTKRESKSSSNNSVSKRRKGTISSDISGESDKSYNTANDSAAFFSAAESTGDFLSMTPVNSKSNPTANEIDASILDPILPSPVSDSLSMSSIPFRSLADPRLVETVIEPEDTTIPQTPKRIPRPKYTSSPRGCEFNSTNSLNTRSTTRNSATSWSESNSTSNKSEGKDGDGNVCKTCKKEFSSREYLKTHEKIHLGIKNHRCPFCESSFVQQAHLESHMRLKHTKERPFKCPEKHCEATFSTYGQRRRHQLTHKDELKSNKSNNNTSPKIFSCSFKNCNYKTGRKDNFNLHLNNAHSDIRPFKCPSCGFAFKMKAHLKRHVKTVHSSKNFRSFSTAPTSKLENIQEDNENDDENVKEEEDEEEPILFKCSFPSCDFATKLNFHLNRHEKKMHQNPSPQSFSESLENIQEENENDGEEEETPTTTLRIETSSQTDKTGEEENPNPIPIVEEISAPSPGQNEQSNFSILRISLNTKGNVVYVVQEKSASNSFSFKYLTSKQVREKFPSLVVKFFESNQNYWKCPQGCLNFCHEFPPSPESSSSSSQSFVDPEAETEMLIPTQETCSKDGSSSLYYSALSHLDGNSSSSSSSSSFDVDEDLEINPDVDVTVERTNTNTTTNRNTNRPYWELSSANYDSSAAETSAGVSHCILVNSRVIHFPSKRRQRQRQH